MISTAKKYLVFGLMLLALISKGQTEKARQILTAEEFIAQVKQFHPIARQANIQVEKADADLLAAKGGFDPAFVLDVDNKTFAGKKYYSYVNPEIKVPLPVGNIKYGAENNSGYYQSDEKTDGRTSYLGVEIPLAKDLLFDKRRSALQKAKVYQSLSAQEQKAIINDLLFDAYVVYWQWAGYYQLYSIYNTYLQISKQRLDLVKVLNQYGDRSLMDTTEAYTQVQNFQIQQNDALIKLNNSALELSNYLWTKDRLAVNLPDYLLPDTLEFNRLQKEVVLDDVVQQSKLENPSILGYNFKISALNIEKRLTYQSLLPTINAKANLLNYDYNVFNGLGPELWKNNYKWGLDVKIPLFFREGRGAYRKAKLRIEETVLDQKMKIREVEYKIRKYHNEYSLLNQQINLANNAYQNYDLLLEKESLRFSNGESSLFVINSRENKVIEMAQKIIDLRVKSFKAKYAIDWAAGLLN